MAYLINLPPNCLHTVSTYLGYVDVFQGIKYTNSLLYNEICVNIKIQRRKNMIYIQLIRQYKYMIQTNMCILNDVNQNLNPELEMKRVHSLIDYNILSNNQNIIINKLVV